MLTDKQYAEMLRCLNTGTWPKASTDPEINFYVDLNQMLEDGERPLWLRWEDLPPEEQRRYREEAMLVTED